MRIVFFGTPEFAVETLSAIHQEKYDIVGVVTAPDKPAGRGQKMLFSPVKKYAIEHNLTIFQPDKLKNEDFIQRLRDLKADLFVVVAFRMLPEVVFSMPPKGSFNLHASLLPNYRGAAPIHHAIINGEKTTGVTTFFLNKEIDKGDIIAQREVTIGDDETTGELYERLKVKGAQLSVETIKMIAQDRITTIPQTHLPVGTLSLAPKIEKKDLLIDWNQPAEIIYNKIRGLAPAPGAYTQIKDKNGEIFTLKCFSSKILTKKSTEKAGTISILKNKEFSVATQNLQISLLNVQFQGKNKMKIEDFLIGFYSKKYTLFLF